jgi:2-octaprenyl-6-methoxyphenol hydroxylase
MQVPRIIGPMLQQIDFAVVGAGPSGLALALHAARQLPSARITVFDARSPDHDVRADPRALALSLGSVQWLQRLQAWPDVGAALIRRVHVSQAPPSWPGGEVTLCAEDQGVPLLGAVLRYGTLVEALQRAWQAAVAREPERLALRLGQAVTALEPRPSGAALSLGEGQEAAAVAALEHVDLAVVAEGGLFADQAAKAVRHDYGQVAWVGEATLEGGLDPANGTAFERFTGAGPLAVLPLPPPPGLPPGTRRVSLVWCVSGTDDPVEALSPPRRRVLLQSLLPREAGTVADLGPLKAFPLGLNAERRLTQGRIVRIGNAAQTLHPVAGQGLNLALRDAYALVAALEGAVHGRLGGDLDAALARLERDRATDRWSMIGTTDFLARSFTWPVPALAPLRGLALAALQRLPPARRQLGRHFMFGWR